MTSSNLDIIDRFFDAYARGDRKEIEQVTAGDAQWTFPGQNPLSGTKKGIDEIIAFFDSMGSIMAKSNVNVEKLITGENENHVIECQHMCTNRGDGINLDHHWCVLWMFKNGKIIGGKHFSAEQREADEFFNKLSMI